TAILAQFAAMDGVQWAVLADREGFVVDATTNAGVDADVAAALSACLAESSDGLGRELGRGAVQGLILEYEKGVVVPHSVAGPRRLAGLDRGRGEGDVGPLLGRGLWASGRQHRRAERARQSPVLRTAGATGAGARDVT